MAFLDAKQDVYKVELTRHGIELLRTGKLDPKFYAFYDDDVLYDVDKSNTTEEQRAAEPRILSSSIIMEPIRNCVGTDRAGGSNDQQRELEIEQYAGQIGSIGKMLPTNDPTEVPRWNLKAVRGKIDLVNSVSYRQDGVLDANDIPQIVLEDAEYRWFFENTSIDVSKIPEERFYKFPDETFVAVVDDYVFVDLQELGVDFEAENFEIELYEIVENYNENYSKPLFFFKKPQSIVDGILLDDEQIVRYDTAALTKDEKLVDYYIDVLGDSEIPDAVFCAYSKSLQQNDKNNIYIQDGGVMSLGSRSCENKSEGLIGQYIIRKETDLGDPC
jgi:hypothetical protein